MVAIHGLVCDVESGNGSFWPSGAADFGVTDFYGGDCYSSNPEKRFMVCLPMGVGTGPTLGVALSRAMQRQHENVWMGEVDL